MQLILVTNVDLGQNKYEKYIYIGCSFINVIGGYLWLLVPILFVAINVF